MVRLSKKQWRMFLRLKRKHNVSIAFLLSRMHSIQNFIWYAMKPHVTIRTYCMRNRHSQRVVLHYYCLRSFVFDQRYKKMLKRRRQNVKMWSKTLVSFWKRHGGINEFIESLYETERADHMAPDDVSKQMKEQLELLKSGKRDVVLMEKYTDFAADADAIEENKNETASPIEAAASETNKDKEDLEIDADKIVSNEDANATTEEAIEANKTNEDAAISTEAVASDSGNVTQATDAVNVAQATDALNVTQATDASNVTPATDAVNVTQATDAVNATQATDATDAVNATQATEIANNEEPTEATSDINSVPTRATEEQSEGGNVQAGCEATATVDAAVSSVEAAPPAIAIKSGNNIETTPNKQTFKVGINFLDMLMNKVGVKNMQAEVDPACTAAKLRNSNAALGVASPLKDVAAIDSLEQSPESCDEFLGFDETERVPGMLQTPLVPSCSKSIGKNAVFESDTLNEYMRKHQLESVNNENDSSPHAAFPIRQITANLEGLMTPNSRPPRLEMPAVPETLQRLRTVAERRAYLQKCSKSHKLAIINNEVTIYRELQRKMRYQKSKSTSQQVLQGPTAKMPFTRNGWQAASFVATEYNKYYFQMLDVDNGKEYVKLLGVRGNNEERNKKPFFSYVPESSRAKYCTDSCVDQKTWRDFKIINVENKNVRKLNQSPLPCVFRPCPLSHKPYQKPLDDDTAALLLAGGSMAVVRMPTVELEVFPEKGKPLHEIAKRYLQYILPHHDISREWAEFSVSTLQEPSTMREKEAAAASTVRRKSFTFVIPYANDRSKILVRRVVDRSEDLDEAFLEAEKTQNMSKLNELEFRANLDANDQVATDCADVLTEMINCVAISCSENSFIKSDPDDQPMEDTDYLLNVKQSTAGSKSHKSEAALRDFKFRQQHRFLKELKRLNCSIIDAGPKVEFEEEVCDKSYCRLGCLCNSLSDGPPIRQHCGKAKCIFQCSCKAVNQSHIMRIEPDGRTITTEDAYMLRRKATERLARMEKEFTSTIVLTANETLLINESQYDKKRRCTKAPKRYDDYADTDDERTPTKRASSTLVSLHDSSNDKSFDGKALHDKSTELREPIYVKEKDFEQLKHCSIPLNRLDDIKNMAVWCMVHELYKCFCGGRAVDGKPLIIEKEPVHTTTAHGKFNDALIPTGPIPAGVAAGNYVVPTAKAHYSFEKLEEVQKREEIKRLRPSNKNRSYVYDSELDDSGGSEVDDSQKKDDQSSDEMLKEQQPRRRGRPRLTPLPTPAVPHKKTQLDADKDNSSAEGTCRRMFIVPSQEYTVINSARRQEIYEFIGRTENEKTRMLLTEHVLRSVYFHKQVEEEDRLVRAVAAAKKFQKQEEEEKQLRKERKEMRDKQLALKNQTNDTARQKSDTIDVDEDSRMSINSTSTNATSASGSRNKRKCEQSPNASTDDIPATPSKQLKLANSLSDLSSTVSPTTAGKLRVKKFAQQITLEQEEGVATTNGGGIVLPRITSCVSLNDAAPVQDKQQPAEANVDPPVPPLQPLQSSLPAGGHTFHPQAQNVSQHPAQLLLVTPNAANAPQNSNVSQQSADTIRSAFPHISQDLGRTIYNDVIQNMNLMVSKKMQDIDNTLRRVSKGIPAPHGENLCIIRWNNFLDGFHEGNFFVWQVNMRNQSFLAATITNMMPIVLGALGVVNIAALRTTTNLPLIAQMLLRRHLPDVLNTLAVVMQGRLNYWLIKGFLRAYDSVACAKPTPETHPILTKKINVLCTSLVNQRARDMERKLQLQQTPLLQQKQPQKTLTVYNINKTVHKLLAHQTAGTAQLVGTNVIGPAAAAAGSSNNVALPALVLGVANKHSNKLQKAMPAAVPCSIASAAHLLIPINNKQPAQPQNQSEEVNTAQNMLPPNSVEQSSSSKTKRRPDKESPTNVKFLHDLTAQNKFLSMKSNIEFRKVTKCDIDEIHVPESHKEDHRWLVLDLYSDFSHIFVPDFRDLVSLDRIQKLMSFCRQKAKIVKLQFSQNAPFDAFVTPQSKRKLYFGPLKLNTRPPLLLLLQSVDGQMMLREAYEAKHNICNERSTTAFWILQIKGQTHFEVDTSEMKEGSDCIIVPNDTTIAPETDGAVVGNAPANDDGDSDEDCVIVDPPESDTMQANQETDDMAIKNATKKLLNFTIQTSDKNGNQLEITAVDGGSAADMNNVQPFLPIVTNMPNTVRPFALPIILTNTNLLQPQTMLGQPTINTGELNQNASAAALPTDQAVTTKFLPKLVNNNPEPAKSTKSPAPAPSAAAAAAAAPPNLPAIHKLPRLAPKPAVLVVKKVAPVATQPVQVAANESENATLPAKRPRLDLNKTSVVESMDLDEALETITILDDKQVKTIKETHAQSVPAAETSQNNEEDPLAITNNDRTHMSPVQTDEEQLEEHDPFTSDQNYVAAPGSSETNDEMRNVDNQTDTSNPLTVGVMTTATTPTLHLNNTPNLQLRNSHLDNEGSTNPEATQPEDDSGDVDNTFEQTTLTMAGIVKKTTVYTTRKQKLPTNSSFMAALAKAKANQQQNSPTLLSSQLTVKTTSVPPATTTTTTTTAIPITVRTDLSRKGTPPPTYASVLRTTLVSGSQLKRTASGLIKKITTTQPVGSATQFPSSVMPPIPTKAQAHNQIRANLLKLQMPAAALRADATADPLSCNASPATAPQAQESASSALEKSVKILNSLPATVTIKTYSPGAAGSGVSLSPVETTTNGLTSITAKLPTTTNVSILKPNINVRPAVPFNERRILPATIRRRLLSTNSVPNGRPAELSANATDSTDESSPTTAKTHTFTPKPAAIRTLKPAVTPTPTSTVSATPQKQLLPTLKRKPRLSPVAGTEILSSDPTSSSALKSASSSSSNGITNITYGYLCSIKPGIPRYVTKRMDNTFLVKIPSAGVIKLSVENVPSYMNNFLKKSDPGLASKLPTTWKFVTQARVQQPLQNAKKIEATDKPATATTTTTTTTTATAAAPKKILNNLPKQKEVVLTYSKTTTTTHTKDTARGSKAFVNSSAAAASKFGSDTIFIDD